MFFSVLPQPPHRAFFVSWGERNQPNKKQTNKKTRKKGRKPLKVVILFAFAQICRGIWEHTLTTQELNVLVTVPGGPWWDSCSHCKSGSTEENAVFCLSTFKRNNILMICAIGVILPKWTMIYIFHVRTGFLRGWLIVLVWNNSSGNLFQNWLIHTLHGLSLGFFLSFVLSDNMCAWPIKIKLSLSLPSQIQSVFTKTLYGEGVCVYI